MQLNYGMYFKSSKGEDVRNAFLYNQLPAGWIWHQNTTSGKLPVLFTPCTFMCSESLPRWELRSLQKDLNGATWTVVMQFYWFFTYKNPMIFMQKCKASHIIAWKIYSNNDDKCFFVIIMWCNIKIRTLFFYN